MNYAVSEPLTLLAVAGLSPESLVGLIVIAPLIFLSLTVHEFWHARSADMMGDPTGRLLGRCTLNPMAHLDPIGTIMLFFGPVGWAKPVPVNPLNFRNPSRGMIISVAAGPLSNLGMGILAGLTLRAMAAAGAATSFNESSSASLVTWVVAALGLFMQINFCLFLFNLIPLYPLDGHHLLREVSTPETRRRLEPIEHMGGYILLFLVIAPRLIGAKSLISQLVLPPAEKLMLATAGTHGLLLTGAALDGLQRFFLWT